jgi:lipopolysaccharide transport system permease protein
MGPVTDVSSGRTLKASLTELWASRETALAFAQRDLKVKYKQTGFGVAWALFQPLAFVGIFIFVFGGRAGSFATGSYGAFLLSALIPWTFLVTAVTFGSSALLTDAMLLRKVYFPRELPVLGAVLASTVDLAVGVGALVVVGPFFGTSLSPAWLLLPLVVLPLVAIAIGVSLGLGALNVYYRDVRYAIPFAMTAWLFLSPVVYPLDAVAHRWRWMYVVVNPVAGVLDSFRRIVVSGTAPDPTVYGIGLMMSTATLVVGHVVFRRLEPNMADVV